MQKQRFFTCAVHIFIFASLSIFLLTQPLQSALQSGFNPDFDGSGVVDFPDFLQFVDKFGFSRGDSGYESRYDLNGDGEIAFDDFLLFVEHFGKAVFRDTEDIVRPTGELKPWDLSSIVSIDEVRNMPVGTPVFMRTEFANGQLADLEMTFIQVVDDLLPPMPIYLVEASDPVLIQLGGIAQGMSGSPIFTEQGTWGAIAYTFADQDSPPYYHFVTPIEWIIGNKGAIPLTKRLTTWEGSRIKPLDIPLLGTGFNPAHQRSELTPAGRSADRQDSFEAGRPLAVGLVLGEVTLAVIGTISYVDGKKIYGFGHSMDDLGVVELPIIEAKILGSVSATDIPWKYATLNPTVRGTLTEDRIAAVRGVLGERPELIPVKSIYAFPSGYELELVHRVAVGLDPFETADLIDDALYWPLVSRIEDLPNRSVRLSTNISFVETDSILTRSRLYVEPEGRLWSLASDAFTDLRRTLLQLITRDDYAVQIREAEIHIDILPESRFAKIVGVDADSVISVGSTLSITTSLRVGRREDREIEMAFSIPDSLPAGIYQIEVGSLSTLEPDSGRRDETLEDFFALVNSIDGNVILKANLMFVAPLEESELPEDTPPPDPVSMEKDVDLFLEGFDILEIRLTEN